MPGTPVPTTATFDTAFAAMKNISLGANSPPWTPSNSVVKGPDGQPFGPLKQISYDFVYLSKFDAQGKLVLEQPDPISPAAQGVNYLKALTGG
jgi:hypothetical protein